MNYSGARFHLRYSHISRNKKGKSNAIIDLRGTLVKCSKCQVLSNAAFAATHFRK